MPSHRVRASYDFLYGHLVTGRAKPYGGCVEIVRKSCDADAVTVQSPHGNRTGLVRAPHRSRVEMVRCEGFFLLLLLIVFGKK